MAWELLQYLSVTWLLLSNASSFSEGLKCYVCYSNISWDVCEKNRKPFNCLEGNEVCVKEHEIQHGNQQRFTKFCDKAAACTNKHCKDVGRRCTLDCCHEDLCNEASTMATSQAATVFLVLLVNIISTLRSF